MWLNSEFISLSKPIPRPGDASLKERKFASECFKSKYDFCNFGRRKSSEESLQKKIFKRKSSKEILQAERVCKANFEREKFIICSWDYLNHILTIELLTVSHSRISMSHGGAIRQDSTRLNSETAENATLCVWRRIEMRRESFTSLNKKRLRRGLLSFQHRRPLSAQISWPSSR